MPPWTLEVERLLLCGSALPPPEELARTWMASLTSRRAESGSDRGEVGFRELAVAEERVERDLKRSALQAACGAALELRRWDRRRALPEMEARMRSLVAATRLPRLPPPGVEPRIWLALADLAEADGRGRADEAAGPRAILETARKADPRGFIRANDAAAVHDSAMAALRREFSLLAEDRATLLAYRSIRERAFGSGRSLPTLPGHMAVGILLIGGFTPLAAGAAASAIGALSIPVGPEPSREPARSALRAAVDRSRAFWVRHAGKDALAPGPRPRRLYADPIDFLWMVESLVATSAHANSAQPPL